jgi:hypothetical protein
MILKNNVYIFGDLHASYRILERFINNESNNVGHVIQVGDFGWWPNYTNYNILITEFSKHLKIPVWFIDGNHDNHPHLFKESENIDKIPVPLLNNISYLKRASVFELVINEKPYNCLFMGGATSIDRHCRTEGRDWFPEEIISQSDFNKLDNVDCDIDIMFSHTCPLSFLQFLKKKLNINTTIKDPCNVALEEILIKYKPKYWFFGHWHIYLEDKFTHDDGSITRFICLNNADGESINGFPIVNLTEYLKEYD